MTYLVPDPETVKQPSPIFYKSFQSHVWIRPEGRGTFVESPLIKEFVERCLNEGSTGFVIDLEDCPGMDSTFMGMLAGLAIQFRKTGEASLAIVGTTPRTLALLRELGLHHLLVIEPSDAPWVGRLAEARSNMTALDAESVADQEAHICQAHEDLCEADEANLEKFGAVLEMLGSDMPRS